MQLKKLSLSQINFLLKHSGIVLAIGPFNFSIQSSINTIASNLRRVYGDFNVLSQDDLIDFNVRVDKPLSIRSYVKPQVFFYHNDKSPFLPLPFYQAFPLLEWGMNWCIAQYSHQFLMLHSAVLEKNGTTIICPAESGSGKSTLTALLSLNGWRLLSDEMALISTTDNLVTPISRPISLKNQSIDVIKRMAPNAIFSDIVDDTNKGTIGHLKPTQLSVERLNEKGIPRFIVFPKYEKLAETSIELKPKAEAFMQVIENSFNYTLLGSVGFDTLFNLISNSQSYSLRYSKADEAIAFFEQLSNAPTVVEQN